MARISTAHVSHFDQSKELTLLAQQGRLDIYWPPKSKNENH